MYEPKTNLQEEQKILQRTWGDRYHINLEKVKLFTDSLPRKVLDNPITDTAEGIQLLLKLSLSIDNVIPFKKLH